MPIKRPRRPNIEQLDALLGPAESTNDLHATQAQDHRMFHAQEQRTLNLRSSEAYSPP